MTVEISNLCGKHHASYNPILLMTIFNSLGTRHHTRPIFSQYYDFTSWHHMTNILHSKSRILIFSIYTDDTITQPIH